MDSIYKEPFMKPLLAISSLFLVCNFATAQRYSTSDLVAVDDVQLANKSNSNSKVKRGTVTYSFTTNLTNPSCDTGFGGYVDLEGFGIFPSAGVIGDDTAFTAFGLQNPVRFFGVEYAGTGLTFSTNGVIHFDAYVTDSVNTGLPDATAPNNILPIFWNDMEIFFDATPGSVQGVSLATAGPDVSIIEYDDPQPKGGGASIGDFEIIVNHSPSNQPNTPEYVVAFGTMGTMPASATVGMEDATATEATQFLFGDPSTPITDGLIVCFEAQGDLPVDLMNFEIE
jgi:hypothetical protein